MDSESNGPREPEHVRIRTTEGEIPLIPNRPRSQGRYWILTIPASEWELPGSIGECPGWIAYIKGQREIGEASSYEHWQIMVIAKKKISLSTIKSFFGRQCHAELTRSNAAEEYVWKEETRVPDSQFELGSRPHQRNNSDSWLRVWESAISGAMLEIEPSIRVQHYRTLRAIATDFARPIAMERTCVVYWGPTGTGKSTRAWGEAGMGAYPKDPRTKFWCAYQDQEHALVDEFRGDIHISHLLRWLDKFPVIVEIKGGAVVLKVKKWWFTSNIHPRQWYPDLDEQTWLALERRMEIIYIGEDVNQPFVDYHAMDQV